MSPPSTASLDLALVEPDEWGKAVRRRLRGLERAGPLLAHLSRATSARPSGAWLIKQPRYIDYIDPTDPAKNDNYQNDRRATFVTRTDQTPGRDHGCGSGHRPGSGHAGSTGHPVAKP